MYRGRGRGLAAKNMICSQTGADERFGGEKGTIFRRRDVHGRIDAKVLRSRGI